MVRISGKLREIDMFARKTRKSRGKCKICGIIANKLFKRIFSPELLGEKFENALEISGKAQEIQFLKHIATLIHAKFQASCFEYLEKETNLIVR